jgi:uncharacterized caspase-like protein
MTESIFESGDRLRERGGVGFFYYAGHGMEVDGENYLIPVGAEIPSERYVKLRGVPMGEVTTGLAAALNKLLSSLNPVRSLIHFRRRRMFLVG